MKTYSKQYLATIITGVGLTFFSITAVAETIGYEQSPGHYLGGFQSDGELVSVADEFQLDQSALIRNITWWGGYLDNLDSPPPVVDDVNIRLYADQGGKPGVLLRDFHVGNNVNRVATGDWLTPPFPDPEFPFPGRLEFKYSSDLPGSFLAAANTRYWLSIVAPTFPDEQPLLWEVSDSPINPSVRQSFAAGGVKNAVFGPSIPTETGRGFDNTAFQVWIDPVEVPPSDSPEPSSVILLATVVGLTMFVGRRRRRTQEAAPCGRGGW